MLRQQIATAKKEKKDRIHWRNHEVTRIEAFSDAVFAFAITLLIVSLEVPKTFDELVINLKGFIPFAICFTLFFQIWHTQNIFFRRYGLHDTRTIFLNGILIFTVLFFVYPLKFLYTAFILGGHDVFSNSNQMIYLWYIYSGGFAAIYLLFTLMYINALKRKDALQLTGSEIFETKTTIYEMIIMIVVAISSIVIASFGHSGIGYAGIIYAAIGPAIGFLHSRRGKKHRILFETVSTNAEVPVV